METPEEVGESFIIREASEKDILTVMNINRICLPENYSYAFFHSVLKAYPRTFLVAEVDSKIAGYIMCRVERILSKLERFRIKKAGHIISIAVLPEYRRRGIASTLLRKAMTILKEEYGCDEIFLEVRVTNSQAIALYKKLGFDKIDVLKGYYVDGEDAYVMARKL